MTYTPSYLANPSHHLPLYRFDLAKLSVILSVRNGAITQYTARVYKNPEQVSADQIDEAIKVLTHLRSQIL